MSVCCCRPVKSFNRSFMLWCSGRLFSNFFGKGTGLRTIFNLGCCVCHPFSHSVFPNRQWRFIIHTQSSFHSAGADGKLNRVDAQSPVQAQTSSQQHTTGSTQQQAFINPAAATLPPGYNYYTYPGSMLPAGYQYSPAVFPVGNIVSTKHTVEYFILLFILTFYLVGNYVAFSVKEGKKNSARGCTYTQFRKK